MNMYRILGDFVGTREARVLAEQLVTWHDSMVKHLRVVGGRGTACADDCPHEEAAALWAAADATFGVRAADLAFLRSHGQRRTPEHYGREYLEDSPPVALRSARDGAMIDVRTA